MSLSNIFFNWLVCFVRFVVKSIYSIIILIVSLAALYLPRREKELSTQGEPILRYYGPALLCLLFSIFLGGLKILVPGKFGVNCSLGGLYFEFTDVAVGGVLAIWFFIGWKTVLKNDSIEGFMWPLPPFVYHLSDVVSVRRGRNILLRFSKNRRFGVLPFASGYRYFVDELDVRLKAIGK